MPCTDCAVGDFATEAGRTTLCTNQCLAGQSSSGGQCFPCSPGTYSASAGGACQDCPPGKDSVGGSTGCALCAPGKYSSQGGVPCRECIENFYMGSAGATFCSPCPGGKVSPVGATQCSNCTAGKKHARAAATPHHFPLYNTPFNHHPHLWKISRGGLFQICGSICT